MLGNPAPFVTFQTITDIRGKHAYYMQFKGGGGYVVDEIKNGELVLFDNAYDGMALYLHRVR